jgi:uncharacterized membrane protein
MTDMTDAPAARTRRLQNIATASFLCLIVLSVLWEGWLAPARGVPPGLWLTLKTVPLLLPLFGLLHGKPYTFAWASMLMLPYLAEGVVLSYQYRAQAFAAHNTLPYALLETLLSAVFIVSASYYARDRSIELAKSA